MLFPLATSDPQALPAPVAVLKTALLLALAIHLLAVNLGVGGSVVLLGLLRRGHGPQADARRALARVVAGVLPPALTFAITLGVGPLLLVQVLYGRFFYTATVLMAAPWAGFVFVLGGGYALLYQHVARIRDARPSIALGLLSVTLLLCVGFLWVNATTLSLRPAAWTATYLAAPHGMALNLGDVTALPRFLHVIVAMASTAGLYLAVASEYLGEYFRAPPATDPAASTPSPEELRTLARRTGLAWFIYGTAIELVVGPTLFLLQPASARDAALGGSLRATVALGGAVVCAVTSLALAVRARNPATGRRGVLLPFLVATGTVAGMVVWRDAARDAILGSLGFDVAATPVSSDLAALALLTLCIVGYALCLRAMVRWTRSPFTPASPATSASPSSPTSQGSPHG